MQKKVYETCCVHSTGDAIRAMTETARDISWSTFARHCDWREWATQMGYGAWLQLKDDYAVSFHRSAYLGQPCYYVRHSAIEHIFI